MTTIRRLRALRLVLAGALIARAMLIALAAAAVVAVTAATVDVLFDLPLELRRAIAVLAPLAGALAAAAVLRKDRAVWRVDRVALWVEERDPAPEWALVTLLETPRGDRREALESRTREIRWQALARSGISRALAAPLFVTALALLAVGWIPAPALERIARPRPGDVLLLPVTDTSAARDHLAPLVVVVTPPAYLGGSGRTLEDPAIVSAITRSRIELAGRWTARARLVVSGPSGAIETRTDGARWLATLEMPLEPAVIRLRDGVRERLLALDPILDQSPSVAIQMPARDSVLRVPAGRLALAAQAADDHGIARGAFEAIVSSGEGESFTFRTVIIGSIAGRNARALDLRSVLLLDSLRLGPGDVVHLRATARDANPAPGEGLGTSETRTLRVARRGEYDSVAVEGAPPLDAEKGVISQRMLIMLAEALVPKRPRLPRATFVAESRAIARDQRRLRAQVGEIIFARLDDAPAHSHDEPEDEPALRTPEELLRAADSATSGGAEVLDFEHGESPVVAINRPLLEAYNFMWDATRELEIGEPARALPHMRAALAAIQRARAAERIYLRGRPPAVVVDLARVRLRGAEAGSPAGRDGRPALAGAERRRQRIGAAILLAAADPGAARDSLLLIRVEALGEDAAVAAALTQAIAGLRAGGDATEVLVRLRRVAAGPTPGGSSTLWSGW